jgi:hypothetical protein
MTNWTIAAPGKGSCHRGAESQRKARIEDRRLRIAEAANEE